MTLTPNTSAIDSVNGIVALDNTATASGFGVQLASKQSGTYVAQNLAGSMVVTPTVGDSSGSVRFPLGRVSSEPAIRCRAGRSKLA